MNLNETNIPMDFHNRVADDVKFDWEPNDTYPFYKAMILAITELLSNTKNKEHKVACKVEDTRGNFKFAGIVQYHPNTENENMPGNWSYVLTFDKEDLTDCGEIHNSNDPYFYKHLATAFFQKFDRTFGVNDCIVHQFIMIMADTLLTWMDANAGNKPEEGKNKLEVEGYFEATAELDGDTKVFSMTPSGDMKRLIKNDTAIQK